MSHCENPAFLFFSKTMPGRPEADLASGASGDVEQHLVERAVEERGVQRHHRVQPTEREPGGGEARPVMPIVDSVATLPLDAAAMQRGYTS